MIFLFGRIAGEKEKKGFENEVSCQESQTSQPGITDYKNIKRIDDIKNKLNTFQNFVFSSNSITIDFPMTWSIWPQALLLLSKGVKMNRALGPPPEGTCSATNSLTISDNDCNAFQWG